MNISAHCFALSVAVLLMAGCESTLDSRIQEKCAVYQLLTSKQQKQIKAGQIKVGYTSDMVYLALGKPSSVRTPAETEIGHKLSLASMAQGKASGVGTANESKVPVEEWIYAKYMPRPGEMRPPPPEVNSSYRNGEDVVMNGPAKIFTLPSRDPPMGLAGGSVDIHTLKVLFYSGKVVAIQLVD